MAPNILIQETEELVVKEADFTELRFIVSYRGEEFTIIGLPSQLHIYVNADDKVARGVVTRGSSRSGAIWLQGDCIADYFVKDDGTYLVTEIKEAFRVPETQTQSDPVLFLISSLWSQLSKRV